MRGAPLFLRRTMQLVMNIPYVPEPSEVIPQETALVQAIRRAAGKEDFITWRNPDGEWIVSYKIGHNIVDVGYAGHGDRPDCSRGMIETMVSMIKAGAANKGPIKAAQEALALKQSRHLNVLIDKQREELDYRRYLRRKATQHWQDHPLLRV